ncbi:MAG TPA: polysaccharide biosynthesis/export family protein [Verrucomicrobiae bacterium]|jgi:polysaccharide export outer membrane protein
MNLRISKWIRSGWLCLLPVFGLLLAGCETPPQQLHPTTPPSVSHLHIGDTITVILDGPPDMNTTPHEESIKEDQTITLPDIGAIVAAGKTLGQLQRDIHNAYVPAVYTHLTVTVKFSSDRVYYVSGEVKGPGPQLYREATTVSRAITTAGDFTDFASHVVVLTRVTGERVIINCDDVRNGKIPDPAVYPGDQIQVQRRSI